MVTTGLVFVDANIILEYWLDNKNANNCETFLRLIQSGELRVLITDFILYTCLLQIQWQLRSLQMMQNLLFYLSISSGATLLRPTIVDINDATKYMHRYNLDFDDGLVVAVMINNDIKTLYSYDKDFDRVKIINRREP